jgi:hypothetical protein
MEVSILEIGKQTKKSETDPIKLQIEMSTMVHEKMIKCMEV